jgi:hypothetical protein
VNEHDVRTIDDGRAMQPSNGPIGVSVVNEQLRRLASTSEIARNLDDDRVKNPAVVAVVLHHQGWSRVGWRTEIDNDDIAAKNYGGVHRL